MSQVQHEWTSQAELKSVEKNADVLDAARSSASKRQAGDLPAAVDAQVGTRRMPTPGAIIDGGTVSKAGAFHVSPSLDPKNIEAIDGWEDFQVDLRVAHNALSSACVGLEQIANARAQADKNFAWNDYQKLLNVGNAAEKKLDGMLTLFDKARTQLTKLADGLERELTQPLANSAVGGFNIEIRATLQKMSKDERETVVNNAVRTGDESIVAAVLGAPPMLTGVDPLRHKNWTREWHERRSPETVKKLAAVRKAIDIVGERAVLVSPQTELAMRGNFRKLKAIREANSEAEKALLMTAPDDPTA